jgi:hypothetical protein
MRALSTPLLIVAGAVALITSGCSASGAIGGAPLPAVRSLSPVGKIQSWIDPAVRSTHRGLLYVADENEQGNVRIYMQEGHHQHPVGYITTGIQVPMGLFVDAKRNLWVANWNGYEGQVLRYAQGSTTPNLTLNDSLGNPVALWVAQDSTVYVVTFPYSGPSIIVKYPQGSQQYQVIIDPNMSVLSAVAGDAKGNIYGGGLPYSGYGEVDVLPAGKSTWQNTGMITNAPAALALDAQGNLLVSAADAQSNAFLTFRIGHKRPSNRIDCISDCEQVAFDRSGKHLWAVEAADFTGGVFEFDYPSGKRINRLHQPNASGPDGVAASPPLYP